MPDFLPLTDDEREGLDDLDLDRLSPAELRALYGRIQATYPVLEAQAPEDESSEAFLLWEEDLEQLDDFLDELAERLDPGQGEAPCV